MRQQRFLAFVLRLCAAGTIVAGALAFVMLIDFRGEITARQLALPILYTLVAIGAAAAMLGLAEMLSRGPEEMHPELGRAFTRVQTQLGEIGSRISEMQVLMERMARAQHANAITSTPPSTTPVISGIQPSDLEPLYQALHEIRDIAILPDGERRDRFDRQCRERKAAFVKQAFDLVATREWHKAERTVLQMETEFPNDQEVAKSRDYLNTARRLHETEAVSRARREIEQLISIADWDDALSSARALVNGFPDNGEARDLFARVNRERAQHEEINVQRMFEELRHDIDRRMWRRALLHAERILEKYPDHARADGVRRQLKTLQDNAEIEERQEQEVRIQELVKARQFNEAIELAEDLIRRYPLSPQAESLETLLPRIRELARQGVSEFSGIPNNPPPPLVEASPEFPLDEDDIVTGFHG